MPKCIREFVSKHRLINYLENSTKIEGDKDKNVGSLYFSIKLLFCEIVIKDSCDLFHNQNLHRISKSLGTYIS